MEEGWPCVTSPTVPRKVVHLSLAGHFQEGRWGPIPDMGDNLRAQGQLLCHYVFCTQVRLRPLPHEGAIVTGGGIDN